MPKKIYKMVQFHGGLSTNSDPKDIAENELANIVDAMVDELGKIRLMGSSENHVSGSPEDDKSGGWTSNNTPGHGLFYFAHDRTGAEDSGQSEAETGDHYLAVYDGGDAQVWVYSKNLDLWDDHYDGPNAGVVDLGATATKISNIVYYSIDGSLRITDGNFSNTGITSKWYGYIDRKHFDNPGGTALTPGGSADTYDGWYQADSEPAAPTRGVIGTLYDASAAGDDANTLSESNVFNTAWENEIVGHEILSQSLQDVLTVTGYTDADTVQTENTGSDWTGKNLYVFPPAGTGFNINVTASGSGASISSGNYKFATSFIYDKEPSDPSGGWQESPLFACYGVLTVSSGNSMHITAYAHAPYNPRITGGRIYTKKTTEDGAAWMYVAEINLSRGLVLYDGHVDGYYGWEYITSANNTVTQCVKTVNSLAVSDLAISYETKSGLKEENTNIAVKYKTATVTNRMAYIGNVLFGGTVYGDAVFKSLVNKFDTFDSNRRLEASINDGDNIVKLENYADRLLIFKKNKLELMNISQEIEFLEDIYMHKGVSHYSATCKTDFGIAWVNKHGCYLYDGQRVSNLLEKKGRQIIKESEWESFITDFSTIGYIPKKRQLIVLKNCRGPFSLTGNIDPAADTAVPGTGTKFLSEVFPGDSINCNGEIREVAKVISDTSLTVTAAFSNTGVVSNVVCTPPSTEGDIYLFDLVTQSWVKGDSKCQDGEIKSNFITDWDGDLVYLTNTTHGEIKKWSDSSVTSEAFNLKTKEIDFGEPGLLKNVYKVIINYQSGNSTTHVQVNYRVDGSTSNKNFSVQELPAANGWQTAELIPNTVAEAKNIKSFQIVFSRDGTVPAAFEINDISVIYRTKGIR